MFEFRRIKKEEKEALKELEAKVYNELERKDFFMPPSDEIIDLMFDNDQIIAYGAYHRGKLIATAQLYVAERFVCDQREILELGDTKLAGLGGSIVLSEYRKNGIMTSLSTILIQEAKRRNIEQIIITIHPENVASNATYTKMGAEKMITMNCGDYLRNVYLLNVSKKRKLVLN